MRLLTRVTLVATVLALTGCAAEDNPLDNASTCPGDSCRPDVQELFDQIADVDGVADVVEVHREQVVGKPERVTVRVTASPGSGAAGRALAGRVADVVEASRVAPDQSAVTLVWAPTETVDDTVGWTSHQAPPDGSCTDPSCASELAGLRSGLEQEFPDLSSVEVTLDGGRVEVAGRWDGPGEVPAVEVADRVHESAVRGYDTTVVRLVHAVPRAVEVRRGGW
jgi:hypothetical protein